MPTCRNTVWRGLATLAGRELIGQADELWRQVDNKHSLARDVENRKSKRCPCPVNTTSYVVFLTEIHTALVSSGAYKQIIGTLKRRRKIDGYSYAVIYINSRKSSNRISKVLIMRIMCIYTLWIEGVNLLYFRDICITRLYSQSISINFSTSSSPKIGL